MPSIQVSTDGSGAGTGTSDIGVSGFLRGIKVDLTGVHTATDITVTELGGMGRTVLDVDDLTADAVYNPQEAVSESDGVPLTDQVRPFYVHGARFQVTVANGPASITNAVLVHLTITPI